MFQDLGERVRSHRIRKGIPLKDFAEKLGVSIGYLSNFETGKTDTIQLTLLQALQEEIHFFNSGTQTTNELNSRLAQIEKQLQRLERTDPTFTNYLLDTIEKGIEAYPLKD